MLTSKTETETGTLMSEFPIPRLRPGLQDLEFRDRDCENPDLGTKTESLRYLSLDTETRPRVSSITGLLNTKIYLCLVNILTTL